jgi:hypothetical protein
VPVSGEVGSRFAAPVAELIQAEELKLLEAAALALRGDQTAPQWEATALARIRVWRTQADRAVAGAADRLAIAVREALLGATAEAATVSLADVPGRTVDPPEGERGLRLSQDRLGAQLAATLQQTPRLLEAVLREAVRAGVDEVRAGRVTRPQASQQVFNRLALQGITGFRDKAGRNWSLSSYCEMAVRTETQARALEAGDANIRAVGLDLVVVSDSPRECDICRPFEGKVLFLGGVADKPSLYEQVFPETSNAALDEDVLAYFTDPDSLPSKALDPRSLIAGQDVDLNPQLIEKLRAGQADEDPDSPPLVMQVDGRSYVVDGHHRAIAAALEGRKLQAKVAKADPSDVPGLRSEPFKKPTAQGQTGKVTRTNELTGQPVTVDVFTTLAEARAKGFQHPNCTHSYSAYIPGVSKLTPAKANPDGYEQKQRQREMERKVREWKRREALALDPAAKAAARDKVRGWQGQLRKHVAAHDLKRQSGREQLQVVR